MLFVAARISAADFHDVPKMPDLGAVLPLNSPIQQQPPLRSLELAPLLQSLASIPIAQPAPGAPPRIESFLQLDALTAAVNSPAPGAPDPAITLQTFWTGQLSAGAPGDFLETPKARQAATVAEVVAAAWESPTAREVLRKAERLARQSGERVPVVLRPLGNNYGEYDYIDRVLYLNSEVAARDIKEAAATLVHELVHVLQHTRNIPAESLEMELEAHVITLKVLDELGVARKDRGGFSNAAERELRKGPDAYAAWMSSQLPDKILLAGADFDELAGEMEQEIDELQERLDRLKSPKALARAKAQLAAAERDLAIIRSPAGQKRCKDFAAHVKRIVSEFTRRE